MNSLSVLIVAAAIASQEVALPPPACVAPVLPAVERPVKPERPAPPSCVNEATHRHTCSNRVIQAFEASMNGYEASFNAYVDALNLYGGKLDDYVRAANDYAQCERRTISPTSLIRG